MPRMWSSSEPRPELHSVPHTWAEMLRRSMAGAGLFFAAPPLVICMTFSSNVSRLTKLATRSATGRETFWNGYNPDKTSGEAPATATNVAATAANDHSCRTDVAILTGFRVAYAAR